MVKYIHLLQKYPWNVLGLNVRCLYVVFDVNIKTESLDLGGRKNNGKNNKNTYL